MAQVYTGRYHLNIKKLHEKYGPIVRIGPNLLDLDYPELNKVLYNTDGKWKKVRRRVPKTDGPDRSANP